MTTKLLNNNPSQDWVNQCGDLWVVEFTTLEGKIRYICTPRNGWNNTGFMDSAKKFKKREDAEAAAIAKRFGNPRVVLFNKNCIREFPVVDWEVTETFLHDNEPVVEENI